MHNIKKDQEPSFLKEYKEANPNSTYKDFSDEPRLRRELRKYLCLEQNNFCAYCSCKITYNSKDNDKDKGSHNEHILPQSKYEERSLDYTNLVASCNNANSCGIYKKNNILKLTPLDNDWEDNFKALASGEIKGENDIAKETINILGLNHDSIKSDRRSIISHFLNKLAKKLSVNKKEAKKYIKSHRDSVISELRIRDTISYYYVIVSYVRNI